MNRGLRRAALRMFAMLAPQRAADWFEQALLTPRTAPELDVPGPLAPHTVLRLPYGKGWLGVRTWGESGPAVLLLHGWGGSSGSFGALVDPLVAAGHRVVACDFPAHGSSDGRLTNLIECAGAALQTGQTFGPLAAIVTHSFGGAAAALAIAHGLTAGRVAMIAPPVGIRELSTPVADRVGLPRQVSDLMFERFAARLRFSWDELRTDRLMARFAAPVLVIHDEEDDVVPWSHGAAVARAVPVGRLLTTAGLGHRGPLIEPGIIRTIVEFVAPGTASSGTLLSLGPTATVAQW